MKKYDVIIIGAGPAGVFCAISIKGKDPKINIAIIEKSKPLLKLLLSGGGRCNFSNKKATSEICNKFYPRGARYISSLFYQYDYEDFLNYLNQNEIGYKEEEEEKLFLKGDDSREIVNLFLNKLKDYDVPIINASFIDFKKKDIFESLIEKDGEIISIYSNYLVISTGSDKKILEIIKEKNILVKDFIPSLFGLKSEKIAKHDLKGISVRDVAAKIEVDDKLSDLKQDKVMGDLLFTHQGISGPVVLKLSSYYAEILKENKYKTQIHIDFFPKISFENLLKTLQDKFHKGSTLIKNICFEINLPFKLWSYILELAIIPDDQKATNTSKNQGRTLGMLCKDFKIDIEGKAQDKGEFVSAGGVELKEVDKECRLKKIDKLYFIGEILNIDGITGGYNLQAAWTTSFICANSIVKSFSQNQK